MLIELLKAEMQKQNFSLRQASREIGVSHTTLHRILGGSSIDLNTLVKVSKWLSVNPLHAVKSYLELDENEDKATRVAMILDHNEALKDYFEKIFGLYKNGVIDMNVIYDCLAYLAFRLNSM